LTSWKRWRLANWAADRPLSLTTESSNGPIKPNQTKSNQIKPPVGIMGCGRMRLEMRRQPKGRARSRVGKAMIRVRQRRKRCPLCGLSHPTGGAREGTGRRRVGRIKPNQTKSNLRGWGGSGQWPVVGGRRSWGRLSGQTESNRVKPSQTESNQIKPNQTGWRRMLKAEGEG
jgi:hypothetical protein